MPRKTFTLNEFVGINNVKDSRDIADQEVASSSNFMFDKQGALRTAGKFTDYTLSNLTGDDTSHEAGYGLFYFESDRALSAQISGTTTDPTTGSAEYYPHWGGLVWADGDDFTNSMATKDPVFYALFGVGDKVKVSNSEVDGGSNNGVYTIVRKRSIDFGFGIVLYVHKLSPTLKHIYESVSVTGVDDGHVTWTKVPRLGENIWIKPNVASSSSASSHHIKFWNSQTSLWATDGIQTAVVDDGINGSFKPRYYYADLALRVSDSNFLNQGKIKWYGFIERTHFNQDGYLGWEVKDNTLAKPSYGLNSAAYPTGAGKIHWEIVMSAPGSNENESTWVEGSYELASSHIYDGDQESQLYAFSNAVAANSEFTVAHGEQVKITAKTLGPFDSRMSGARLYCRARGPEIGESDESWSFLAEADFAKGIKTSLSSDYKVTSTNSSWFVTGTINQHYTLTSTSVRQNADTYESINGFPSDLDSISLGATGDSWKTACVASRRVFIANVSIYDAASGSTKKYGDRIMYSEIGKYDTFPSYNFIDVVKGDAEEYVELVEYGDRLLAFKHNTLFVLNIANPSPTAWFLEKTFKHKGIKHSGAVFRTEDGVIWVNDAGCWAYNGDQIQNLIDNKLDPVSVYSSSSEHGQSWRDFYTVDSIIGYSPKYKQILILKDCTGTSNNYVYCYDTKTGSWSLLNDATNFFTDRIYSNFILDGDGELAIATSKAGAGTTCDIRYYSPQSVANSTEMVTKYIDFDLPNNMKKIYKVAISYKSSVTQADILTARYVNKNGGMQNSTFGSNLFDSLTLAVHTNWGVAVFKPTAALSCQSIQFRIKPPSSGTIDINEIMVYYRAKKTIVKSGV